ncbi:MAG: threonyl-tRNA synthetase editing domain-containing protein [Myxococcota bacterium]
MRILMWHLDSFRAEVTEKGRSPIRDEVTDETRVVQAAESLLVYAACEKDDEVDPGAIAQRCTDEIIKLATNLGTRTVILHSFAHLFVELAAPQVAVDVLKDVQARLAAQGYTSLRTPFGWFHTLSIQAKGHPLSRVARQITLA